MIDISRQLLNMAKSGDSKSVQTVFDTMKPEISACAAKLRTENFDFDDAVQEGNIGLFKAILSYRPHRGASFYTYAKKCILNNMLSARRSASAQKHELLTKALPLDESILLQSFETDFLVKEQNREFIRIAKKKLSQFEFLVFSLYTMQYSYKEISQITGKSEKSVNNAIQRIHAKLRK